MCTACPSAIACHCQGALELTAAPVICIAFLWPVLSGEERTGGRAKHPSEIGSKRPFLIVILWSLLWSLHQLCSTHAWCRAVLSLSFAAVQSCWSEAPANAAAVAGVEVGGVSGRRGVWGDYVQPEAGSMPSMQKEGGAREHAKDVRPFPSTAFTLTGFAAMHAWRSPCLPGLSITV